MNTMRKWMDKATPAEQLALAEAAETTRNYLYQVAGGHRTVRADLAGRIEVAAKSLRKASKNRLPELTRADLSGTCAKCPYAKKCLNLSDNTGKTL